MCRNAETLKRLQEAEKKLKEQQKAAYIDLGASEREREAGNEVRGGLFWQAGYLGSPHVQGEFRL